MSPRAAGKQTDYNPFPGKPRRFSMQELRIKYQIKVNSILQFFISVTQRGIFSYTIVATEDTSAAKMCWKLNRNSSLGDIPKPAKLFQLNTQNFLYFYFILYNFLLYPRVCVFQSFDVKTRNSRKKGSKH